MYKWRKYKTSSAPRTTSAGSSKEKEHHNIKLLYILVIPYKECFDWNYSFLKTIGIESDPSESSINNYIKKLRLDDSCTDDVEKLLELSKYNKQYLRSLGLETSNSSTLPC